MMITISLTLLVMVVAVLSSLAAQDKPSAIPGYQLEKPSRTLVLDSTLREVSGLSIVPGDDTLLACIQDEAGIIYFLRKSDGSISCSVPFKGKGDFEGLEVMHKRAFAIKSNGDLYAIDLADCQKPRVEIYQTGLTKESDVESLASDLQKSRLLFATKSDPKVLADRQLYQLNISTLGTKQAEILFHIKPEEVRAKSGSSSKSYFSPSGVTVNPMDGNIWIISSASREIAVFDETGKLLHATRLQKELFPQPEGICFDAKGNLFISNEAKQMDTAATILLFEK